MVSKPIILITGANGGLGAATIKSLCESPQAYHILVASRSQQKGQSAIAATQAEVPNTVSTLEALEADLESDESIERAFKEVSSKHDRIDDLINNAGVNLDGWTQDGRMSKREMWNKSWDVNVTGTHIMTETFIPLLLKSKNPRLLFVTSGTTCLAETERMDHPIFQRINACPGAGWPKNLDGHPAYRSSKTGMNMMMREWCRYLKEDGVKIFAISPGFLATGFGGLEPDLARKFGAQEPSVAGNFIHDVVDGKRDREDGKAIRVWPMEEIQLW